ncbi:hypothetical protein BDW60DRAFT_180582 [Aspergillus nidulans var. acristatus]
MPTLRDTLRIRSVAVAVCISTAPQSLIGRLQPAQSCGRRQAAAQCHGPPCLCAHLLQTRLVGIPLTHRHRPRIPPARVLGYSFQLLSIGPLSPTWLPSFPDMHSVWSGMAAMVVRNQNLLIAFDCYVLTLQNI